MGQWTCIEKEIFENNFNFKRKEIILDDVFPAYYPQTSSSLEKTSDDLKVK
jgi:hypothetical protein